MPSALIVTQPVPAPTAIAGGAGGVAIVLAPRIENVTCPAAFAVAVTVLARQFTVCAPRLNEQSLSSVQLVKLRTTVDPATGLLAKSLTVTVYARLGSGRLGLTVCLPPTRTNFGTVERLGSGGPAWADVASASPKSGTKNVEILRLGMTRTSCDQGTTCAERGEARFDETWGKGYSTTRRCTGRREGVTRRGTAGQEAGARPVGGPVKPGGPSRGDWEEALSRLNETTTSRS